MRLPPSVRRTLRQWRGLEPKPPPTGPSDLWPAHPQRRFLAKVATTYQHPKYSRETNLRLWLEDYRLACQAGGANDDDFIIRNLSLFLADLARAWLEHLPSNAI